jgi:hypothetical protein
LIDVKQLKIPSFDGEVGKFDDCAFALKRTIRSVSRTAYEMLTGMETLTDDINENSLDGEVEYDLHGFSAELYDILCQACSGETLSLVRGVEDMLGATAW